eukprot:360374-Chlamydomonas_euryale.AAC.5
MHHDVGPLGLGPDMRSLPSMGVNPTLATLLPGTRSPGPYRTARALSAAPPPPVSGTRGAKPAVASRCCTKELRTRRPTQPQPPSRHTRDIGGAGSSNGKASAPQRLTPRPARGMRCHTLALSPHPLLRARRAATTRRKLRQRQRQRRLQRRRQQ